MLNIGYGLILGVGMAVIVLTGEFISRWLLSLPVKVSTRSSHFSSWTGICGTVAVVVIVIFAGPGEIAVNIKDAILMILSFFVVISIPNLSAKLRKRPPRTRVRP